MTKKTYYFDHASTTPVNPRVLEAMHPFFSVEFGNPSGSHRLSQKASAALSRFRNQVAEIIGCNSNEIVFTSGGSESNNLALKGALWHARQSGKGSHVLTSQTEHPSVLSTLRYMRDHHGFDVEEIPVKPNGLIDLEQLEQSIRKDSILITCVYVSPETGAIQPILEVGEIAERNQILFHCDAVQAAGVLPIKPDCFKASMMTLSSHKFYGPKGIGVLYVKSGTLIQPQITGGPQENELRAGTQNLPQIAGLAAALRLADETRQSNYEKLSEMTGQLRDLITTKIPTVILPVDPKQTMPGIFIVLFPEITADSLLMKLDLKGICASSGSACSVGNPQPSELLIAMGTGSNMAEKAIRFSLGDLNTKVDIEFLVNTLVTILPETKNHE